MARRAIQVARNRAGTIVRGGKRRLRVLMVVHVVAEVSGSRRLGLVRTVRRRCAPDHLKLQHEHQREEQVAAHGGGFYVRRSGPSRPA